MANTPSIFTPPTLVYPIGGAVLGYVLSGSIWGTAFGAAIGAIVNLGASAVSMETLLARQGSVQLSDNSLSIAARSFIGQGAAKPVQDMLDQAGVGKLSAPAQQATSGYVAGWG